MLTALEGLVAMASPALFVETSGDAFWLNYTAITYGLSTSTVTSTFVLQHFDSYFTDGNGKAKIVMFLIAMIQ